MRLAFPVTYEVSTAWKRSLKIVDKRTDGRRTGGRSTEELV